MNANSNAAKAIFLEAVEQHGPDQWPTFLDRACAGQPELRRLVEMLLQAHQEVGTGLNRAVGKDPAPSQVATVDEPIGERPGTVIGPYKLLEQIGEGGFGLVYMAEQQQPLRRMVALKILKPGMDTRQIIARFEAERQALALMDHPHIARVFDGGETVSGRPYFVMELVRGIPITDYCDQSRSSIRQRLELFVHICQAVQHAHQKGIIHRDLKPSNVLVTLHDGTPVVKVIDFGIAKATGQRLTDKTLFTHFAQLIGTPLYMSPEQAALSGLDVDTRSDIYSLGVLLYELLTGTTPFDKERLRQAGYDELRRIIREEEPPRPSTRINTLGQAATTISIQRQSDPKRLSLLYRDELDWVVMKALEKDRNRRYESATGFALDVQRYLTDEPVLACPPSTVYRLRKFARRNHLALLTGAVVTTALLAGTAVSSWQAVRATRALHAESREHQRANANLYRAVEAVERFLDRVTYDPRLRQADLHELRRDLLASAVPFYEDFVTQDQNDPELEGYRGRAFRGLFQLRWEMGDYGGALRDHEQARAIFTALAHAHPEEPKHQSYLARSLNDLGNVLRATGKPKEAEMAYREALDIKKQLADAYPEVAQYQLDLGAQYGNVALCLMDQKRNAEALPVFREGQRILKPLVRDDGPVPAKDSPPIQARRTLSLNYGNLGLSLYQQGDPQCEPELREAIRLLSPLHAAFPNDPVYQQQLAAAQDHLGNFYREIQQLDKATAAFEEAVKLSEPLTERFPLLPNYQSDLGATLSNLGMLRMHQGQLEAAQHFVERAVVHQRAALKINPRHAIYRQYLSNHYAVLADILLRRGQHAAMAEVARRLAEVRADNGEDAYEAAGFLAQCIKLAQEDSSLPKAKKDQLSQRYAEQAMNLLREAIQRGFRQRQRYQKDKEIDALRRRADFQKLVASLEADEKRK